MYFLYSVLLGIGALLTSPYWVVKALRERKYLGNFRQRLGLGLAGTPAIAPRPLWIHAVSVGEVLAAKPLCARLREARPEIPLVVSTVTVTGQALARKEFPQAAAILYFPFDWDFCIRRFLKRLDPRAVVLLETELWPNFLRNCSGRGVPVFLANGRISERSHRRYRLIPGVTRTMLSQLSLIGAQSVEDRRRFVDLGAPEDRVCTTGNLKFDFPPPAVDREADWMRLISRVLGITPQTPVVVVGSSMKGEEELFVEAFKEVRRRMPGTRLVLAPRHPERFDEVAELIGRAGVGFVRRSRAAAAADGGAEILLLDTIGELRSVYHLASVAVIGGSFGPFGGHNLLEPAALGKAVVIGPEMSNFRDMAALFVREQAVRQCAPADLAAALAELLANDRARTTLGQRASLVCRQNQGAAAHTLSLLTPCLG